MGYKFLHFVTASVCLALSTITWASADDLDILMSLPYVNSGSKKSNLKKNGVTRHIRGKVQDGFNIYCSLADNKAHMIDSTGKVVKTWTWNIKGKRCLHVELDRRGRLFVVFKRDNPGIMILDPNSNILFSDFDTNYHHDLAFLTDDRFMVLAQRKGTFKGFPAVVDQILQVQIGKNGAKTKVWTDFEYLANRPLYASLFDNDKLSGRLSAFAKKQESNSSEGSKPKNYEYNDEYFESDEETKKNFDLYHMNTVAFLPKNRLSRKYRAFRRGNVLTCFRNLDLIAIVDRKTRKPVWSWGPGVLEYPHMPSMLPSGNILVFDNGRARKWSRVVEVNPLTKEIVWQYHERRKTDFYSKNMGSSQRLANGNTLITSSNEGRAFEVDRAGRTVWEWWNPGRNKEGERSQLYRMTRVGTPIARKVLSGR